MRAMAFATLAASLLSATAVAAQHAEHFQQHAVLGTTRLSIATTVTTLSSAPGNERFRVSGALAIDAANAHPFRADPWRLIDAGVGAGGIVSDITAIDITGARLAYFAGNPQADALILWMGCGANCSGASTILTYDAAKRTYVVARWEHQPDWDTVDAGDVVHVDAHHDAIATHVPGPFDDCGACLPGVVPVWYAVSGERIVDVSRHFAAALAADAAAAWRSAAHEPAASDASDREIDLFRYLADECRIGSCASGWQRVEKVLRANGMSDAIAEMRSGIDGGRYGRI